MVGHPLSALRPNGAAGSAFRSIKRRRGRPPATGSWTTLGPALPSGIPAPPPSSHSRHSLASRLAVSVTGRRGSLDLQLHSPEPHRTRRAAPRPKRGSPYSPSAVPFVAVPRLFAPLQALTLTRDLLPSTEHALDFVRRFSDNRFGNGASFLPPGRGQFLRVASVSLE